MKTYEFTVVVEFDEESGMYMGSVPNLPLAISLGATLEELRENMREVIELVIEHMSEKGEAIADTKLVGVERVAVSV
jgi:predicted RNase H-like HicB family nuclease